MTTRLLWVLIAALCMAAPVSADDPAPIDPGLRNALANAVGEADSFANRFDAEVWLLDMATRLQSLVPDHVQRLQLLRTVHREATRAELQPELVLALIQVESAFKRYAISYAGARGLMQIMPFWKDEIGRPDDNLFRVDTNLRYGCSILRYYLDIADGDMTEALARYNGSYGQHWYPARVRTALSQRWYAR